MANCRLLRWPDCLNREFIRVHDTSTYIPIGPADLHWIRILNFTVSDGSAFAWQANPSDHAASDLKEGNIVNGMICVKSPELWKNTQLKPRNDHTVYGARTENPYIVWPTRRSAMGEPIDWTFKVHIPKESQNGQEPRQLSEPLVYLSS